MNDFPQDWSETKDRFTRIREGIAENFESDYDSIRLPRATPVTYGYSVGSCIEVISAFMLMGDGLEYQPMLEKLCPYVDAISKSRLGGLDKIASPRLAVVYFNIFQKVSGKELVSIKDPSKLLKQLCKVSNVDEEDERELIWAHLAHGETNQLGQILLFDPIKAGAPDPSAQYEFNVQGLQRHLTQALVHQSGISSVEKAWQDFVDAFPRLRGARVARMADLFMVAHAVYCPIGGHSSEKLLPWLKTQIS